MQTIATNKKAYHDYQILETLEVGIKLTGPEVKSVKSGSVSLKESFVHIEQGDPASPRLRGTGIYIKNMHVGSYKPAHQPNYDPTKNRKLLANKKEIANLSGKLNQKGLSIVPTKIYLKNGLIKLEIGVVKGKKKWDKREAAKKRDLTREAAKGIM